MFTCSYCKKTYQTRGEMIPLGDVYALKEGCPKPSGLCTECGGFVYPHDGFEESIKVEEAINGSIVVSFSKEDVEGLIGEKFSSHEQWLQVSQSNVVQNMRDALIDRVITLIKENASLIKDEMSKSAPAKRTKKASPK